jgi:hypothetical protein
VVTGCPVCPIRLRLMMEFLDHPATDAVPACRGRDAGRGAKEELDVFTLADQAARVFMNPGRILSISSSCPDSNPTTSFENFPINSMDSLGHVSIF